MKKLALIVGHDKKQQGATSHKNLKMSEYAYGREVAALAQRYAKGKCDVHVILRDYIGITGAYNRAKEIKPDACIELHFNAYDGSVQGTEILYHDDRDMDPELERRFGQKLLDNMYEIFDRGRRGKRGKKEPQTRDERGWYNVSRVQAFPCVLVEPFFGDNPEDAQMAKDKMDEYAHSLIDAFMACFEKNSEAKSKSEERRQEIMGQDSEVATDQNMTENKPKKKKRGSRRKRKG